MDIRVSGPYRSKKKGFWRSAYCIDPNPPDRWLKVRIAGEPRIGTEAEFERWLRSQCNLAANLGRKKTTDVEFEFEFGFEQTDDDHRLELYRITIYFPKPPKHQAQARQNIMERLEQIFSPHRR